MHAEQFEITEAGDDAMELLEALVVAVTRLRHLHRQMFQQTTAMSDLQIEKEWMHTLMTDAELEPVRDVLLKHYVHKSPAKPNHIFGVTRGAISQIEMG